jgi:3D (Asp-Asp-Asp) domain-containing protein
MRILIARSLRRKIVATLVGIAGFFVFYEATIFDSRFATRQLQTAAPAANPVTAVVSAVDPAKAAAPAPDPGHPAVATLRFVVSAYCKGEITASGVVPRSGIAAADQDLLPVGSVIQVSSIGPRYDGVYTIMDTGPKVQGHELDIYLWSCKEAVSFGRRAASVVVLRLGWNPRDTEPTLFDRLLDWGERTADKAIPRRKR